MVEGKFVRDEYGRLYPPVSDDNIRPSLTAIFMRLTELEDKVDALQVAKPAENWRTLSESVRELWDKMDALQVANYEITRTLSALNERVIFGGKPIKTTWVEEELEAIKNQSSERVCKWCKWGNILGTKKGGEDEVDCHYDPHTIVHIASWFCSKWGEK